MCVFVCEQVHKYRRMRVYSRVYMSNIIQDHATVTVTVLAMRYQTSTYQKETPRLQIDTVLSF